MAMGAVAVLQARRQAQADWQRTADNTARALAAGVFDDLYRLDVHALRLRLASVRLNAEVSEVYVTDAKGVVLADGTVENPRRDAKLEAMFVNELLRAPRWMSAAADGDLRVGGPIAGADGTVLGFVVLTLSPAESVVLRAAAGSAAAGGLLLVVCVGLLWLVAGREERPQQAPRLVGDRREEPSELTREPPTATAAEAEPAPVHAGPVDVGFPRAVVEHLLNGIGDAVIVTDPAGKITSVNDSAIGLLGYDRDELIGQALEMVLGSELGDLEELAARTALSRVARTLTPRDGSRRPVWLSAVVVRQPDGSLRDVVCLAQPVGAQEEPQAIARETGTDGERAHLETERRELEDQQRALMEARTEVEALRVRAQEELERAAAERERYEKEIGEKAVAEPGEVSGAEIERLNAGLQAAEERVRKAEDEQAQVFACYESSETGRKEAEQSLEEARRQIEAARREAEEVRGEASTAQGRLDAAQREVEEARKELQEIRQGVVGAEAAQADGEFSRLKRERDDLAESLKQAREERELMVEELDRTRAYWKQQEERWQAERAAARPEAAMPAAPAPISEAATAGEMGEQPVLDKGEALGGVDGDLEFLKALVDVFMESSARQMAELGAAIERGDAGSLERTARMLKGVVGTFGARAAAAAALQLETIGIVGDMDRAQQAYENLDAEIERLKPALVELVSGG